MFGLLCASNTAGVILLICVLLFCLYSILSFIFTLRKRSKEKKARIAAKEATEASSVAENTTESKKEDKQ